jgi:SAM-dependent methyltransferase
MRPYADHFSRLAPAYATCRPRYPPELFVFLSQLPPRRELAWDCAAGSGQATLPLTRWFSRVLATDVSSTMLERAAPHPQVEYRVSRAENSGLPDSSADLVTVAQALHWLDVNAFYTEVDRVLAPGGVLAAWSYGNQRVDGGALDAGLRRFYSEVVGPFWPEGRRHVEAGYSTLPFPYAELQVPVLTMEEQWTLDQLLDYLRTWSATQRFRDVRGYDPVIRLAEDMVAIWGDPATTRLVRWPLSLRVGRK